MTVSQLILCQTNGFAGLYIDIEISAVCPERPKCRAADVAALGRKVCHIKRTQISVLKMEQSICGQCFVIEVSVAV